MVAVCDNCPHVTIAQTHYQMDTNLSLDTRPFAKTQTMQSSSQTHLRKHYRMVYNARKVTFETFLCNNHT